MSTFVARSVICRMLVLIAFILPTMIPFSEAEAVTYTFTTIDFPGASDTQALGINAAGQIVGIYYIGGTSGTQHAYLRSVDGTFTTIDPPGSVLAQAAGINDSGAVVGTYQLVIGQGHGFMLVNGTYTTIDVPGATPFTAVDGINNLGEIVGSFAVAGPCCPQTGFLRDANGNFTTITVPGAVVTQPRGINDSGLIVGAWHPGFGGHGFTLEAGVFTTIDFPGVANSTAANGANAGGQIVGTYDNGIGRGHGFLLDNGTFTTIDPPGSSVGAVASGINVLGTIVGAYFDAAGGLHGYMATPPIAAQITNLTSTVQTFNLSQGITGSLDAKLQNAEAALTAAKSGSVTSTCNMLTAFINATLAQSGKALTVDQANQLLSSANRIKAVIGCP